MLRATIQGAVLCATAATIAADPDVSADAAAQWYAGDHFGDLFAPKATKAQKDVGKN